MLIRIIYVSTAVDSQSPEMTNAILQGSQVRNRANDVTGVLCQGNSVFLQCLEGERKVVTQLYARIYADPRHTDVQMIHCESIPKRRYKDWSMAHVDLAQVDPLRQVNWSEFDPYSATGVAALARIDEVLSRGTAVSSTAARSPAAKLDKASA